MGCTQSKIENEEAVSRCKDRKQFMKEAVYARNAFAAAHSAYAMSLKNTGAALSDYAHGEVQNPQFSVTNNQSPAALPPASQARFEILPPPPLPFASASGASVPLQRATSMPEIKMASKPESAPVRPARIEEEDDEMEIEESSESLVRKRSSRKSGGASGRIENHREVEEVQAPRQHMPQSTQDYQQHHDYSTYDYFFPSVDSIPGSTLGGEEMPEEVKVNKEEIERRVFDEKPKKVEEPVPPVAEKAEMEKAMEMPVVEDQAVGGKVVKKVKMGEGAGAGAVEKRLGKVGNVNLLQIFVELDDHFLKASESAHEVSKMLEATRLHYHSNFADNRGVVHD